ncbi:MAG: nitroreductase family protein [Bacilli bacterium]
MNKTLETIENRQSIRSFTEQEVSTEDLQSIIRAARNAPTARNRQPLCFYAIKDKKILLAINDFLGGNQFYQAPAIVLCLAIKEDDYLELDLGAAMENMLLACESLSLSACWIHCAREKLSTPEGITLLKELLHIDFDFIPCDTLVTGYTNEAKPARKEKDYSLDKIL